MVELIGYLLVVSMMTVIPAYRFVCMMLRWVLSYVKDEIRRNIDCSRENWSDLYPHDVDRFYKKVAFFERRSEGFLGISTICLVITLVIMGVVALELRELPFVDGYIFTVERFSNFAAPVVGWISVLILGINLFGAVMSKYTKLHLLISRKRK